MENCSVYKSEIVKLKDKIDTLEEEKTLMSGLITEFEARERLMLSMLKIVKGIIYGTK